MDCGQNMQGCVVPSLSFLVRSRVTKLKLSSGIISTFERPQVWSYHSLPRFSSGSRGSLG